MTKLLPPIQADSSYWRSAKENISSVQKEKGIYANNSKRKHHSPHIIHVLAKHKDTAGEGEKCNA